MIKPDQILAMCLQKGPSGVQLNSSFRSRDRPEYRSELGNVLVNVSRVTPGGVLIFFPSYTALTDCETAWKVLRRKRARARAQADMHVHAQRHSHTQNNAPQHFVFCETILTPVRGDRVMAGGKRLGDHQPHQDGLCRASGLFLVQRHCQRVLQSGKQCPPRRHSSSLASHTPVSCRRRVARCTVTVYRRHDSSVASHTPISCSAFLPSRPGRLPAGGLGPEGGGGPDGGLQREDE